MVWYYCDFCNRNINVKAGTEPFCKSCNVFIYSSDVPSEVRKQRQKERTTRCGNCKRDIYAVPIEAGIHIISKMGEIQVRQIEEPKKKVKYVRDRRYKSGYREEEAGMSTCLCIIYCIITLIIIGLAIITYGIALLGFIPVYLYYRKKQKKKREMVSSIQEETNNQLQYLYDLQGKFYYFCKFCYKGVSLKGESPLQQEQIGFELKQETIICEKCGSKNTGKDKFCTYCGTEI